ncbi:Similar to hypothetical protein AKAW_09207 [Aspergillus kawachii IFO 4308]; acc. no. GAA91093 [Pyronema omphalodes CBS 100304]|uniref:Uncharacterized protein n=1 Tax=Pyronema omphalodes (strain CBS 100304) TaxID=1076935 RepID=U4LWC5_PYROM|nr:Similar to hypothetical protein AKAW_09207 [Aspergillus kawachii IFO 4308]; acc. no. GAA91093 [Pyronema omphalodes CBS 100304]
MDGIVRKALAEGAVIRCDLIAEGRLNPEKLEKTDADRPAAFVDGKWGRFKERWEEAMKDQMVPSYGMGIEEVRENLEMMWVEEKSLDGAYAKAVRRHIRDMKENDMIPEGLDWPMVLVVNSAALKSLVDTLPLRPLLEHADRPFVLGVDLHFDEEEQEEEDEYPGEFKVGIATLLNDLFPHLATGRLAPEELHPGPGEGQGPSGDVWMFV